jgi:3'(2'), 5'-bisphosphate nucleotidase
MIKSVPMLAELSSAMRTVGTRILDCRQRGLTEGKWEGTQFKAVADQIADECMRNELRRIANVDIVSEEDASSQSHVRPARYWLIDPIDGTASFAQGFSGFVCQAAFIEDGQALFAVVNAPALDCTYSAARGYGAQLNGVSIKTRSTERNDVVLVDNYPQPQGMAEQIFYGLPCSSYVESGSIGLKICLVAQGAADLFVKDVIVRDWDVAAPALILSEAGGALRRFDSCEFQLAGSYEKSGLIAVGSPWLMSAVTNFVRALG